MLCSMICAMPARRPGASLAEVGEPAVVGLQPGPSRLQVAGVGGRGLVGEAGLREERRHGVREDDLGDDAVGLELLQPAVGVPVAVAVRALHVLVRDLVRRRPGVEIVMPARRQIGPVVGDPAAAVTVGGDDDVPVVGHARTPWVRYCNAVTVTRWRGSSRPRYFGGRAGRLESGLAPPCSTSSRRPGRRG